MFLATQIPSPFFSYLCAIQCRLVVLHCVFAAEACQVIQYRRELREEIALVYFNSKPVPFLPQPMSRRNYVVHRINFIVNIAFCPVSTVSLTKTQVFISLKTQNLPPAPLHFPHVQPAIDRLSRRRTSVFAYVVQMSRRLSDPTLRALFKCNTLKEKCYASELIMTISSFLRQLANVLEETHQFYFAIRFSKICSTIYNDNPSIELYCKPSQKLRCVTLKDGLQN